MSAKVFQLQKRASYEYKFIQDKYAVDTQNHYYAIADGTTQSFNSEGWANLLTSEFIATPESDIDKLLHCFQRLAKEFKALDYTFSPNPAKASLEREKLKKGATSTFLGIKLTSDGKAHITNVGDSNLFIINPDGTNAFPFESLQTLDSNQFFLNTEQLLNGEIDKNIFQQQSITISDDSILILATDALSRLFLKSPETIHELIQIEDFTSFHKFCVEKWEGKTLEEDDITAVVIYNFTKNTESEIIPPNGFSFPKETKSEFIPSFVSQQQNELSASEMQHITNSVNQINHELYQVKRSSKSQQALLLALGGLVFLNTLLLAYLLIIKPISEKSAIRQDQSELIVEKEAQLQELKAQIEELNLKNTEQSEEIKLLAQKIQTGDSLSAKPRKKGSAQKEKENNTTKDQQESKTISVKRTSSSTADSKSINQKSIPDKNTLDKNSEQKIEADKQTSSTQNKD